MTLALDVTDGQQSRRKGIGGHQRGHHGESDIWLTPLEILRTLGEFDLDPCAAPEPRPWPTARTHYAQPEQNGLYLPWIGRVWLNPPYGSEAPRWLARLSAHGDGLAILFARTETEMFFRYVWEAADAVLFLRGRPTFCRPNGKPGDSNSGAPVVLVAYGAGNVEALRQSGLDGKLVLIERAAQAAETQRSLAL
jgi:hypothetical protein